MPAWAFRFAVRACVVNDPAGAGMATSDGRVELLRRRRRSSCCRHDATDHDIDDPLEKEPVDPLPGEQQAQMDRSGTASITCLSVQSALVKPPKRLLLTTWSSGLCPGPLAVIQRHWRRSVTRRAARRAEREALDGRRAGATAGGVRAGAHAYLGPRPCRAVGRRHDGDGVLFPLGEVRCGRSVFAGRPRGRGGSRLSGAGRGASADVGR